MRRFAPKKSLRAQVKTNVAAHDFYRPAGVEPTDFGNRLLPQARGPIVNRTPKDELEGAVSDVIEVVLLDHPAIIFAVRQNSGGAWMNRNATETMPVFFYKWVKGKGMRVVDYWGLATFGMFAIEAKRKDWKFTGSKKEIEQRQFMRTVVDGGGRAGFATSGTRALQILSGELCPTL